MSPRFKKVTLAPQEYVDVPFTLSAEDLQYVGIDSRYVLEAGEFYVGVGSDVDCRSSITANWESVNGGATMCQGFNLTLSDSYNPICDYGCALWGNGLCGVTVDAEACATQCAVEKWTWNYVDCLQQYDQGMA